MSNFAFIDETYRPAKDPRPGYYQLTAAIIKVSQAAPCRLAILDLIPGELFHASVMANEGRTELVQQMLDHAASTPYLHLITVKREHSDTPESARQACLAHLLQRIDKYSVISIVADTRNNLRQKTEQLDTKDENTFRANKKNGLLSRNLTLTHKSNSQEGLLALPDAVGWAFRQHALRGNPEYWDQVSDITTVTDI